MARFRFKAKNNEGKVVKGTYFAEDENELREILSNQNYYLVNSSKVLETSEFFSIGQTIKIDDITNFARQFGIMLKSGISISDSLDSLKNTTANRQLRKILEEVHMNVLNGSQVSDALSKYPKYFPEFFINMTRIGEITGGLDSIMMKLAEYYEKDSKMKRKAKSSLAYPTFLICLVFVVIIVLSVFVLPMFDDLFRSFGADLPTITQVVIDVSNFFKDNILVILLVILALFLFFRIYGRTKSGRFNLDKLKISLPIIGSINKAVLTSRFASGFSTLLASGVQLVEAVDTMGRLLGNKYIESCFETCKSELRRGKPVAKSIATINIFPPLLIEMISVGEDSGELETVLDSTSSFFDDEVDRKIKKMTSMIEPAMIMIIAVFIALVLLAVFLPMLGLMDAIEQYSSY